MLIKNLINYVTSIFGGKPLFGNKLYFSRQLKGKSAKAVALHQDKGPGRSSEYGRGSFTGRRTHGMGRGKHSGRGNR